MSQEIFKNRMNIYGLCFAFPDLRTWPLNEGGKAEKRINVPWDRSTSVSWIADMLLCECDELRIDEAWVEN
jgi:hypothetical protein